MWIPLRWLYKLQLGNVSLVSGTLKPRLNLLHLVFFPPRYLASPSHPMVSIEVMLNSTLSHLVAYTTALESILVYHLEECHSNRQALARVPQPPKNNAAPQGLATIKLQRPPPSMGALKFGLDTFHPGPSATPDLQPLRSFGDRKSTRLNSSHSGESRMPSSA